MESIHEHPATGKHPHLRLIVDNTGTCADAFAEYALLKQRWDSSRHSGRPDNRIRLAAFTALKAWSPEAAEPYGAGETWGFA